MEGVGMDKGLIRYASENGIKDKKKLTFTRRMKAYTIVLFLLIGLETYLLVSRSDYDATIIRAKGMLYQERENDQISNLFSIKFDEQTKDSLPVEMKVREFPNAKFEFDWKGLYTSPGGLTPRRVFVYFR